MVECARRAGFPAARSRVVIRLAQGRKAKPNANMRTLRPDKCLVVMAVDSSLRPVALRNMESTAITTRELKAGREGRLWGDNMIFRCRGGRQAPTAVGSGDFLGSIIW
jgi:hypothetical protein